VGNLLIVNLFSTLVLIPFVCVDLLGTDGRRRESVSGSFDRCSKQVSVSGFMFLRGKFFSPDQGP
jgi:hypothetical protein